MVKNNARRGRLTNYDMPYFFSEEEKLQLGQDLVAALENITTKEAEYKRVQKEWKDEIDGAKGNALLLRHKVKSGQEFRPVAARMLINMRDGLREYYAVDTDELLGTTPMWPGDEQLSINDMEGGESFDATDEAEHGEQLQADAAGDEGTGLGTIHNPKRKANRVKGAQQDA